MVAWKWRFMLGYALVVASIAFLTTCITSDRSRSSGPRDVVSRIPMPTDYFVENVGQVENSDVLYYHRAGGIDIGFAKSAILLKVLEAQPLESSAGADVPSIQATDLLPTPTQGVLIRLSFDGADAVAPVVREEQEFRSHYFLGNDPAAWRTGVRSYEELTYPDLYPGIDLVVLLDGRGLKYEFRVAPGADPNRIAIVYEGIEELQSGPDGQIRIRTAVGDLQDAPPSAWDGRGNEVACSYVVRGPRSYGFLCEGWKGTGALVIDPLLYSTFLGGSGPDFGFDIALDAAGNAYVTGSTLSPDFPVTAGAFDELYDDDVDAFIAKIDPSGGTLLYATFLGGGLRDKGEGIAVDGLGSAYVTGETRSSDFPTTPGALDTVQDGDNDGFVAKIDPSGGSLIYGTFLGGNTVDLGRGIAVDGAGNAYVTGATLSPDFPTTPGAFDTSHNGSNDAFVAKLDPSGSSLVYGTYIGGGSSDGGSGIDIDGMGNAYVAGATFSSDFPTTPGAFDTSFNLDLDVFVVKVDPSGGSLIYGTYLGGDSDDMGLDVAVDGMGNAYVTGRTHSMNFPVTAGAFDASHNGLADAFVAKVDSAGASLLYGTYLGGTSADAGLGIAVDGAGSAYITGETSSSDFPTTPDAFDTTYNLNADAFVAKVDPTGGNLIHGTFLGGRSTDTGSGVAVDGTGNAFVVGSTQSDDFPTTPGAFDTSNNFGNDAFVAKISIGVAGACPRSQGFWKNHPASWPVSSLILGGEAYDQAESINLLRTPTRGDASLILAKQLIAAKLNIADGSDPSPVVSEVADADALYAAQSGKLPYDVRASTPTGQQMVGLAEVLDDYNNKLLTPGCTP